ncbi:hypothetical protein EV383_4402 [Pseudonocardia sediminis]|uniref:Uncharacterized protein n=1 Tax=Pseudonocardia sediminis TaxID=1397368 RepID=A0A4Q7UZA1_PSEST|nr:hypothetical protein [Pseudonocardia sediminis]RZT87477.1 hypothetical protein EV383_4402 [Pseudonocardia sediminis]
MPRPQPAHIEILEYTPAQSGSGATGVLKANELRINGTPILCPKGETIRVHAMEFNQADGYRDDQADLVKVTVTMFAHRILIEQRGNPEAPPVEPIDLQHLDLPQE